MVPQINRLMKDGDLKEAFIRAELLGEFGILSEELSLVMLEYHSLKGEKEQIYDAWFRRASFVTGVSQCLDFLSASRKMFYKFNRLDMLEIVIRMGVESDFPKNLAFGVGDEFRLYLAEALCAKKVDLLLSLDIYRQYFSLNPDDSRIWKNYYVLLNTFEQKKDLYKLLSHMVSVVKYDNSFEDQLPDSLEKVSSSLEQLYQKSTTQNIENKKIGDWRKIQTELGKEKQESSINVVKLGDIIKDDLPEDKLITTIEERDSSEKFTENKDKEIEQSLELDISNADKVDKSSPVNSNEKDPFSEVVAPVDIPPPPQADEKSVGVDKIDLKDFIIKDSELNSSLPPIPGNRDLKPSSIPANEDIEKVSIKPTKPRDPRLILTSDEDNLYTLTHLLQRATNPQKSSDGKELVGLEGLNDKKEIESSMGSKLSIDLGSGGEIDGLKAQDWRSVVRNFEVFENMTEKLSKIAFETEVEKHIALQAFAILSGETHVLADWQYRVWRYPSENSFHYKKDDITDRKEIQNVFQNPLFKFVMALSPLLLYRFSSEFSLVKLSKKLGLPPNDFINHRKPMVWNDPFFQEIGLDLFKEDLASQQIVAFSIEGLGPELFLDGRHRAIYFDFAYYRERPISHLKHRIMLLTDSFTKSFFVPLSLDPLNQVKPLLMKVREMLTGSMIDDFRYYLGMNQDKVDGFLRKMDRNQLSLLSEQIESISDAELIALWKSMWQLLYQEQLAKTLDLVGLVESLIGSDLIDYKNEPPVVVVKSFTEIQNLLLLCARMRI